MDNIVIFGAPGSGKGTYSAALVEKFGYNHISTGDVLRSEIREGTELGKIAEGYIEKGQLIPDDLIIDMLADVYDTMREGPGVIFDGFPRTIPQAKALDEMGITVDAALSIEVDDSEIVKRIGIGVGNHLRHTIRTCDTREVDRKCRLRNIIGSGGSGGHNFTVIIIIAHTWQQLEFGERVVLEALVHISIVEHHLVAVSIVVELVEVDIQVGSLARSQQ